MKRILFITLIISAFATIAGAQPDPERREERIRSFRVAIFTDVLSLTTKEAEAFWPVYNEYVENREKLAQQYKPGKPLDNMSDAEVEEQIRRHFERQAKELDLEKELYQRLRNILPARKIAKIPQAERQFRESLLKKMKEIRDQRQGRAGGKRNLPDDDAGN